MAKGDFQDAWNSTDNDGFTFPPCNPEKRIDFILVRNTTRTSSSVEKDMQKDGDEDKRGRTGSWKVKIADTRITGRDPTPDTGTNCLRDMISLRVRVTSPFSAYVDRAGGSGHA